MNMHALTLSYVVKGPLIIVEERVALDLVHSSTAQSNLPAHSRRERECEQSLLDLRNKKKTKKTHTLTRSSPPPNTVINMSSQTHGASGHNDGHGKPQTPPPPSPTVDAGTSSEVRQIM